LLLSSQLDQEDFAEEQNLVARLLHVLVNDNPEEQFKVTFYLSAADMDPLLPNAFVKCCG
jgi:hypothetical protein